MSNLDLYLFLDLNGFLRRGHGSRGKFFLLRILREELQKGGDVFTREKSGASGADIVQQIRTPSATVERSLQK